MSVTVFEMYWSDYEDYRFWLLTHPDKTTEEFHTDCQKAVKEVGPKYVQEDERWIGVDDWIEMAVEKMVEYGYKRILPEKWGFSGGHILDGQDYADREWADLVGVELVATAVAKNATVANTLDAARSERGVHHVLTTDSGMCYHEVACRHVAGKYVTKHYECSVKEQGYRQCKLCRTSV